MQITWKNKINLHLNQSYINVWNRNSESRFRIPLITIPIQFQTIVTDSTIDIHKLTKTDSDSNSHWSQSQPQVWIIFHS